MGTNDAHFYGFLGDNETESSYTPTFANTTLGNGTVAGGYTQVGNTVWFRASFILGGTSAVGTNPTVSLPVTASSTGQVATVTPIGITISNDTGTNSYPGPLLYNSTTTAFPTVSITNATYATAGGLSAAAPFAYGSGDGIYVWGRYIAA